MEMEHKEIRSNGREHKWISRNRKGPKGVQGRLLLCSEMDNN
jgi:hypothetical protein